MMIIVLLTIFTLGLWLHNMGSAAPLTEPVSPIIRLTLQFNYLTGADDLGVGNDYGRKPDATIFITKIDDGTRRKTVTDAGTVIGIIYPGETVPLEDLHLEYPRRDSSWSDYSESDLTYGCDRYTKDAPQNCHACSIVEGKGDTVEMCTLKARVWGRTVGHCWVLYYEHVSLILRGRKGLVNAQLNKVMSDDTVRSITLVRTSDRLTGVGLTITVGEHNWRVLALTWAAGMEVPRPCGEDGLEQAVNACVNSAIDRLAAAFCCRVRTPDRVTTDVRVCMVASPDCGWTLPCGYS